MAVGAGQRGFEVGQAGADAQADGQGAGKECAVGFEFFRGRGAAQGGGGGEFFAEATAALDLGEDGAAGLGGEAGGEYACAEGEEDGGGDGEGSR